MKIMVVNTGFQSQSQWIFDNEIADKAYADLTIAMASYDKYGNDRTSTVTINVGDGSSTFRLDQLIAVSIEDCALSEKTIIEREVYTRQINAKITARLAPTTKE